MRRAVRGSERAARQRGYADTRIELGTHRRARIARQLARASGCAVPSRYSARRPTRPTTLCAAGCTAAAPRHRRGATPSPARTAIKERPALRRKAGTADTAAVPRRHGRHPSLPDTAQLAGGRRHLAPPAEPPARQPDETARVTTPYNITTIQWILTFRHVAPFPHCSADTWPPVRRRRAARY